jgi:hypothetical protein
MNISKKELKSIINETLSEMIDYDDYEPQDSIDDFESDALIDLEDTVNVAIEKIKKDQDDDGSAYEKLVDISNKLTDVIDNAKDPKVRDRLAHQYDSILGKIHHIISGGGGAEKFYMKEAMKISKKELIELIRESIEEMVDMDDHNSQDPDHDEMLSFLMNKYKGLSDPRDIKDDAEVAMYYFAMHYHDGQSSNLYKLLSNSVYKPGPNSTISKEGGLALDMYKDLEYEFGGKKDTYDSERGSHDDLPPGEDYELPPGITECEGWEQIKKHPDFHMVVLKEKAPPGYSESDIHNIKNSLRNAHPNWPEKKVVAVAFATAWKQHGQKHESVSEAAKKKTEIKPLSSFAIEYSVPKEDIANAATTISHKSIGHYKPEGHEVAIKVPIYAYYPDKGNAYCYIVLIKHLGKNPAFIRALKRDVVINNNKDGKSTKTENMYGSWAEATGSNPNIISAAERRKINNIIHKRPELGGNVKFPQHGGKSKAIGILANALKEAGFVLDMVTGDLLLGDKGSRMLTFRRESTNPDPFIEGEEIKNSAIHFNWENLGTQEDPNFEIVAYAS